ncbi:hypothetical protein WME75_07145 [Sorangium sp. So ce1014]|uniref:hypothetical protein n=1 Tax=Sorangium sp. So ce1014 TaxID=3133326 RepID=UPI003F5FD6AB
MSMNEVTSPNHAECAVSRRGTTVGSLVECALQCMASQSLEQVVARAVSYIEEDGDDPAVCIEDALRGLSREEESQHIPLHVLGSSVFGAPLELARSYISATEYLFPILRAFCCSLPTLVDGRSAHVPIYLFMRDSLALWPCLRAHDALPAGQLKLLFYSRSDARHGREPLLVSQRPCGGLVEEYVARIDRGLLIDSGLYGSLIHEMLQSGRCTTDVSVMFFGSRNPFVAGWFNMAQSAAMLDGSPVDLKDVIRLVDTIESLLKPFRATESARFERADAISFICSMAFMWAFHWYSLAPTDPPTFSGCQNELRKASQGRGHWLVDRAVPRWEAADSFLRGWRFGPIKPMNMFCGFDL